jgi:hypothetical protein
VDVPRKNLAESNQELCYYQNSLSTEEFEAAVASFQLVARSKIGHRFDCPKG